MKMKKLTLSLGLISLMFVGCNDTVEYNEANCKFEVQQSLDEKDYDSAIKLMDKQCNNYLANDIKSINYGFSYLGKSGLDFYEIVNTLTGSPANMTEFVNDLTDKTNDDSLSYLIKSVDYFNQQEIDCSLASNDYFSKDICLYSGITEIIKTAILIDALTDDITNFTENSRPDDMVAYACAMEFSINSTCSNPLVTNYYDSSNITFKNNKEYTPFTVTTTSGDYLYLLNDNGITKNVIMTKDECDLDFNICDSAIDTECYACPLSKSEDSEDIETLNVLLDSINNGFDNLIDVSGNKELKETVNKFKTDMNGKTGSGKITKEDIIDYLQNNKD